MKKKNIAGLFALCFGMLGLHRFYLGQRVRGIFHFAASVICMIITVEEQAPVILIPILLGFIDSLLFFAMPQEEFDEKYNRRYLDKRNWYEEMKMKRQQVASPRSAEKQTPQNPHKTAGIEKFKDYDFEAAIEDFKKSLAVQFDDPAVHFNLTCCYSLLEKAEPALFHLGKAVQFGFVDFDKIEKHDGLAFLRTRPEFREFAKNGYQHRLPSPSEEKLVVESVPAQAPKEDLLEQMKKLSELRNQGILTEEEFATQAKRIIG